MQVLGPVQMERVGQGEEHWGRVHWGPPQPGRQVHVSRAVHAPPFSQGRAQGAVRVKSVWEAGSERNKNSVGVGPREVLMNRAMPAREEKGGEGRRGGNRDTSPRLPPFEARVKREERATLVLALPPRAAAVSRPLWVGRGAQGGSKGAVTPPATLRMDKEAGWGMGRICMVFPRGPYTVVLVRFTQEGEVNTGEGKGTPGTPSK